MFSSKTCLVVLAVLVSSNAEIPDYIHICKRNVPDINQCILNSIEALRPKLVEGIPELELPALEPLSMPEVVISKGGPFRALGTNITVHGASDFKILDLQVDIDNLIFNASLYFPLISFEAIYDLDAKFLALPLKGKGPIAANATDIEGTAVINGHKETVDGKTFAMFDDLKLKLKMKNYQIRLENLFNGDKNLGEVINAALNENKKELMNLMRPRAEEMTSKVLLERANKVTRHFNYDELFPSN